VLARRRSGTPSRHRGRLVVAARHLQQVDALGFERLRDALAVLELEATALEVSGVELHGNGKARVGGGAHRPHHAHRKAHPPIEITAPGVGAQVAERREESARQVAMGTVQLHACEPRLTNHARRVAEGIDDALDLVLRERTRLGEGAEEALERHRRGRDGLGRESPRALSPRVVELHEGRRASSLRHSRPAPQGVEVPIVFDHDVARFAFATARHDDVPREQQAGAPR
jgi:hypothetical protein